MKIQLASDLHLEFDRTGSRFIEPAPDADLLVLAGDIDSGTQAVEAFSDWPVPVIYVAGNQEFYHRDWHQTRAELRAVAAGTCVRFLDNDLVVINGVRFLGSTLWTDFKSRARTQEAVMREVGRGLNDYHVISECGAPLEPASTLADHQASRSWLETELAKPWSGRTVVVTHHAPHPLSIHHRFAGSKINGGFCSDLTPLLRQADLWLHGHVHDSFDYRVAGCRVVANPAGYRLVSGEQENSKFDQQLMIEVSP